MRPAELHYTIQELIILFRFSDGFIRKAIKDGLFGDRVIWLNGHYRVPSSGVEFFVTNHAFKYDAITRAKNLAEVRRRMKKGEVLA